MSRNPQPELQVGGVGFTATVIMITNSCPLSHLGALNGLAQSLASLVRGVGPWAAGWLWTQSITPDMVLDPCPAPTDRPVLLPRPLLLLYRVLGVHRVLGVLHGVLGYYTGY